MFCAGRPFLVVEAVSRQNHFEWAKKVHRRHFCMKTWASSRGFRAHITSPSEVHDAHGFRNRPLVRRSHSGPHKPDECKDRVVQQVEEIQPDTLRLTPRPPDPDNSSRPIARIEFPPALYLKYQKMVTSQFLKTPDADLERFYQVFQGSSATASAAGGIFEFRMHQLFRQGYSLKLFPLGPGQAMDNCPDIYDDYAASHKEESPEVLQLTVSEEHRLTEGIQLQTNHYYRPARCFPTIDSLLLIHPRGDPSPILLMFQITRNKGKHYVKELGLEKIRGLKFPSNARRYYVAVTPLGIEPKIVVPRGCFDEVDVYHHPVGNDILFPHSNVKN